VGNSALSPSFLQLATSASAAVRLEGEIPGTLRETQVALESRRNEYNATRPHSGLGQCAPASEATGPWPPGGHDARHEVI